MGNLLNFMQIVGLARQNPQQAALTILNNGLRNGNINKQQYDFLMSQVQNGVNPNDIIQQMMNAGLINQQMYEAARQDAKNFK